MGFSQSIGPIDLAPGATVTTDADSVTQALAGSQLVSSGEPIVKESLRAHAAAPAYVLRGPMDVSQWESLQFAFTSFGGIGWGLAFNFYGAEDLSGNVGVIEYGCADQTPMADNVPVLGPWVTIVTTVNVAGDGSLVVIPRRGPSGTTSPSSGSLAPVGGTGLIARALGIPIAAGANHSTPALLVTSGDATLTIRGDQPFVAVVTATGRDGTAWEIGAISSGPAVSGNALGLANLRIPGTKVAVAIFNVGAAGGTYNLSVVGSIRR